MRRLKAPVSDAVVRCFVVGDMNLSESIERGQIGVIFIYLKVISTIKLLLFSQGTKKSLTKNLIIP